MKKENVMLTFKKVNQTAVNNYLGCEQIEIIAFNYDGKGNALCYLDGEFDFLSPVDIDHVVLGFPELSSPDAPEIPMIYELVKK